LNLQEEYNFSTKDTSAEFILFPKHGFLYLEVLLYYYTTFTIINFASFITLGKYAGYDQRLIL